MRLTTRGRYAVTAMLDLALHGDQGPVVLADIAARQGISLSYLEQLFAKLRKRALVRSVRGPGGGYCLQEESKDISIAAIIDAVSESTDATNCTGKGDCQDGEVCLTHHLWDDLSKQIHEFLSGISLGALTQQPRVLNVCQRQDDKLLRAGGELDNLRLVEAPVVP